MANTLVKHTYLDRRKVPLMQHRNNAMYIAVSDLFVAYLIFLIDSQAHVALVEQRPHLSHHRLSVLRSHLGDRTAPVWET